jgi:hypothetical protein
LLKNLRCGCPKEDIERYGFEPYAEKAEKMNGRAAMMGFIAGLFLMQLTGHIFSSVCGLSHLTMTSLLVYNDKQLPSSYYWQHP